ncbi:MAG: TolC family protein [Polyangiaceae bacterium]|nr:TolC family protein [Polyangiaceae bacterium]
MANTKLLFVRSQNLADLLQTQLWVTMHQEGDAAPDFSIGEDFAASVARPRQIDRLPALMSEALRRRPELRAQNAQIASLDAQASVTRARAFPRIESFASIAAQNPDSRVFPAKSEFHKAWQIGATLTFSPNETVDAVFSASQIEAKKAGAEAQAATLEDAVRMEVADARSDHRDAEASVASTAVSLAAAEEAYRARRELFLNDRATSVELNQAHNDLLRAKLDAVSATVGLRIAVAQVEHAVGRDISR